jgi:hypothetical protein
MSREFHSFAETLSKVIPGPEPRWQTHSATALS